MLTTAIIFTVSSPVKVPTEQNATSKCKNVLILEPYWFILQSNIHLWWKPAASAHWSVGIQDFFPPPHLCEGKKIKEMLMIWCILTYYELSGATGQMDLTLCTGYTEAHTYSHGGTLGFWIQSTLFYRHGQQEKSIPAGMFVCVWID